MLLRPAVPGDVEAVVALVQSAYRGEGSRAGWTTEAHLLEGQRTDLDATAAMIAEGDGGMLLAVDEDGSLVACCQLRREGDVAYFGTFAVSPGRQGDGIGDRMIAHAEATARDRWDSPTMELTVVAQRTDLIPWYERRGYVRTGEQRPFPYGDERFGRPLRDDLVFVVLAKDLTG